MIKLTNLNEINLDNWQKKEKSKANILGYQPKYEIPKTLYEIIRRYDSEGGILKNDLYKIIYKADYLKEKEDYKKTFENSLNLLDQINFIDSYTNKDKILYRIVKHDLPITFELKFFKLLKNLDGLAKSPYILYEQLIRNNIYKEEINNLYEFSTKIQNSKKFQNYNINLQQIPYWVNLFDRLGAITRIDNLIYLLPDFLNCFEILKYSIKASKNNQFNVKLDYVINFFESNFYPNLVNENNDGRIIHPWFSQFIKSLTMRDIIDTILIDDSEAFEINKVRISNLKFKIEMV